jgi:plastocyanin
MASGFSGFWRKGALPGIVLALALVVGVILAGSGAAKDPNASAFSSEVVAQKVMISADAGGAPKWDKATYEAQAGDITFVVSNPAPHAHQFTLKGNGVDYESDVFESNTTNNFTVKNLPAGEYQVICNLHGGMVSKLVVH